MFRIVALLAAVICVGQPGSDSFAQDAADRSAAEPRSQSGEPRSGDQITGDQITGDQRTGQRGSGRRRSGGRSTTPIVYDLSKVDVRRDVAYVSKPHPRQHLDLYIPKGAAKPLPLIVWIHGGAWYRGDKSNCLPMQVGVASRGYAIASIGYRLSGDATFPAQIEDCKAAIRFLRNNAEGYGLDPDRFGVWGSSAGGHLAALVGTSGDVRGFDVGENLESSSRVQAVCDYYGPADFALFATKERRSTSQTDSTSETDNSPASRLLGGPIRENSERAAAASSTTYVSTDDPPFLIVHGDSDPKVPMNQSELLLHKLQTAGVTSSLIVLEGASHGGPRFADPELVDRVVEFFDAHLR